MLKFLLVLVIGIVLPCASEKFKFNNYSLYKILPNNLDQIKLLQDLRNTDLRYDFWSEPTPAKTFVTILSSPENKGDLERFLNENDIKFEITMPDIQKVIDQQSHKKYTKGNPRNMTWDSYYTNDEINDWIDDLAATYPDIVTKLTIGNSYEGRPINGLRISHGGSDEKRVIFLEGGIHAREWISPATVCFITNELLTSDFEETKSAAADYDWYIFPVTNPDGYVWSHESFRMWRKNRRPVGEHFGIDLNRNWNNNWLVVGASSDPESEVYAGTGPFSEPETLLLSRFISSIGSRIDIYLNFHSFGQMLLIPFGNTTEPLANFYDTLNIGRRAMGALAVRYGINYVTGNSAAVIYEASGASDDWVKERLNVPIVYCYELRDNGRFGFLLPGDQIRPTGEETMDSILDLIHQGRRFGLIPEPHRSGVNGFKASSFMMLMMVAVVFLM